MSFERRKVRVGMVVGDKMDKTVVVAVEWRRPYALYRKSVRRRTKFKVHDENNEYKIGDTVRIRESRPLSKTKRWRVVELLQREEVAEIQPGEIVVEEIAEEPAAAPEPAYEAAAAQDGGDAGQEPA
jgi:small subunit ribosomal protein S17